MNNGIVEHDLETGPFGIRLVKWSAASELETHVHAEARMVIVLRGAYRERRGRDARDYETGSAIVRAANEVHSDRYPASGGTYLRIALRDPKVATSLVSCSTHERRSQELFSTAARLGRELVEPDDWSPFAVQGLAFELLAAFGRKENPGTRPPIWLQTIRAALHEDHAMAWSLEKLADLVDVHPAHLGRTFRRYTGIGIGDELRRIRVEQACRLIEGTDLSFAAVAVDCGFSDQSHLARSVRRVLGVTPTAIRTASRPRIGANEADSS